MRPTFAILLACSLSCAAHAADWHPFRWYMASIGGAPVERAAMLLPAKVNGVACHVQLDTGVRDAPIWSKQASSSASTPTVPQARRRRSWRASRRRKRCATPAGKKAAARLWWTFEVKLIGVLGLRPFGDRVITLDYLSGRWSLSDTAAQPSSSGL